MSPRRTGAPSMPVAARAALARRHRRARAAADLRPRRGAERALACTAMRPGRGTTIVVTVAALTLGSCAAPGTPHAASGGARAPSWAPAHARARPAVDPGAWGATDTAPCAGTDPSGCMLPFPNDYDSAPDASTP